MTSSMSSLDAWLPPVETWRAVSCERCGAGMRVPFPPSDGLCAECRAAELAPSVPTTEERLAAAGAPRKYASFTRASWEGRFGPWSEHPQLRHLAGWPGDGAADSWLVFVTSRGYGDRKTGLGTAVLGEALDRGLRGLWLTQSDWLRDLKASWNGGRDVPAEHVVWRRAAEADVLMFDELGGVEGLKHPERSWWRVQVTQLLHYRDSHELPTIVTANLGDWREVRRIHESLVSRMDVALKIALPSGRDYRALRRKR